MPQDISYSNGITVPNAVIAVWDDSHNERPGFYRAYWTNAPDGTTGSPVIGYCAPGGSHRTIKATAQEVKRLYPHETVYRNNKPVKI